MQVASRTVDSTDRMGPGQTESSKKIKRISTSVEKEEITLKKCEIEKLINEAVQTATRTLKDDMNFLNAELAEVKRSQVFIASKHDSLEAENRKLVDLNNDQKKAIIELETKNSKIEATNLVEAAKIDDLEQYDGRMSLEFEGIPNEKNKNINDIFVKLVNKVGVTLKTTDISTARRLPKKASKSQDQPPTTIVCFMNRDKRNEIFFKRHTPKFWNEFLILFMEHLFVNENLTKKKKRLFWMTKQKAKSIGYKFYWTFNGTIFTRKQQGSDKIFIRKEEDLNSLK